MAKTLLQAVNEILKRVGSISGESGELTSLTDSARQRHIDVAIQVVNEGMDELYSVTGRPAPKEQAESTITLATGDRGYALATDLVQLRFPLIDQTNTQFIWKHDGGYNAILEFDPERDDDGLSFFAAINPVNGELYLDRTPTTTENGRIYTYQYDKDVSVSALDDTFPFNDMTFRAMVPAWVQLWKREIRKEFDDELFNSGVGRASRLLSQLIPQTDYSPR